MHPAIAFGLLCLPTTLGMIDLRHTTFEVLAGINKRQTRICGSAPIGTPNPCAYACGPGYQICIALPTCFDPTAGQTCCENGSYCPAGSYCTDAGCCPNGVSVEECGATQVIATIPGIDNPSSATAPVSSASLPSSSYSTSYSSPVVTPPVVTPPTTSVSSTYSSTPVAYTGVAVRAEVGGWAVGGAAALGVGFMM